MTPDMRQAIQKANDTLFDACAALEEASDELDPFQDPDYAVHHTIGLCLGAMLLAHNALEVAVRPD
jgi:hypothetical protein